MADASGRGERLRRMLPARFLVAEESMAPALQPGDHVLVVPGRYRRGDVVVFTHPRRPGFDLVKRVVAAAGHVVDPVHARLTSLDDPAAEPVPDGHVTVRSDREDLPTVDSRTLGPIPVDSIAGRVVAITWPPSRIGKV